MRTARLFILWLASIALAACAAGENSDDLGKKRDRKWAGVNDLSLLETRPDQLPADLGPRRPDRPAPDQRAADLKPPPDKKPPDLKPPPDQKPAGPRTLLSLDFENTSGGLVPSLDWQWGQLAFQAGSNCTTSIAPPAACHSGTRCWGTVLNDCYTGAGNNADSCTNQVLTDDSILRLTFSIPADYTAASLTYWEWSDIYSPFDWSEVRVNGLVVQKTCPSSYTAPTAWVKRTINLQAQIGKAVTVAFHFMASTVVNHAGWYLDDMRVGE